MGKRAPLRKQTNSNSARSNLGKRIGLESSSSSSKTSNASQSKKQKQDTGSKSGKLDLKNDDEDDWDEIERQANENSDNSDDNSDDDDDSDDEIKLQGNVEHVSEDYTFEFNDMRDIYTGGIRTLLRTVTANPTEAYNLADLITAQTIVGTVINCEGGDDAFAFATVLSLRKATTIPTVSKLIAHLVQCIENGFSTSSSSKATISQELKQLNDALSGASSSHTGLLLHQRFSNLPIELIGPLHRNLEEDLSWAKQQTQIDQDDHDADDDVNSSSSNDSSGHDSGVKLANTATASSSSTSTSSGDTNHNFFSSLSHVLLFCPVAATKDFDTTGNGGVKAHNVVGCTSVTFDSFEDEVYFQHADSAVLFKPSKQCNTGYGGEICLVAALVPVSKLRACVTGICALLPDV